MDRCCWADDYLRQPSVTESVILRANREELRLCVFRSIWSANKSPVLKKKQWRRRQRRKRRRKRRCALTGFQEQRDVKSGQKFLLQGQTNHQTNFPSVVLNDSTHLSTWHQCIPRLTSSNYTKTMKWLLNPLLCWLYTHFIISGINGSRGQTSSASSRSLVSFHFSILSKSTRNVFYLKPVQQLNNLWFYLRDLLIVLRRIHWQL